MYEKKFSCFMGNINNKNWGKIMEWDICLKYIIVMLFGKRFLINVNVML